MSLKRPFDATTLPALIMKIMKANFDPVPGIYSNGLKNLLLRMLHLDPNQRPTAAQIMCHPVMIKVIFQLYVDVGSIPCVNRSQNVSQQTLSIIESSDHNSFAESACKASSVKENKQTCVWLCENQSTILISLPIPPEHKIKTVALGMHHKIGITESGLLLSWIIPPTILMNSETKNLGIGLESPYIATIVDERIAINIVTVVCGENFTVCLSDHGVVFTFGKASSGCLGMSSEIDIQQPRIVEALFGYDIKSIACGPRHVLALSEENDVFAWGYGNHGCLGLGATQFQVFPQLVKIRNDKKPTGIFCGADCSFVITEDLSLLACGSNRHNKLAMDSGDGRHFNEKFSQSPNNNKIEKRLVKTSSESLQKDDKLCKDCNESFQIEETRYFTLVKSEPLRSAKVKAVSAGTSHSVILTDHGELYSVGSNRFGQLGWGKPGLDYSMPHVVENMKHLTISQVACGEYFTVIVTGDNALYSWGERPSCMMNEAENSEFDAPSFFTDKYVQSVSCYSENCLVIGRNL